MAHELLPATRGAGPLLQRDYWAVLTDCALTPSAVMDLVKAHFCALPPDSLVRFDAPDGMGAGALIDIVIKPGQHCGVQVVHEDRQSVTFATVDGHPEAGRITFGAYRNQTGEVIFHIRSRARSATVAKRLGFLAIGEAMQTNTWADFIRNAAALVEASIGGVIHAETTEVGDTPDDDEPLRLPTFVATGE
jgi:hypothetical protein